MSAFKQIYDVVCKIPKGKVATYGTVARLAGNPRWARVVGYALHQNPDTQTIPCHRVVNRKGEVVARFEPTADMQKVEEKIKDLLL